jgi:hypothetical protein
VTLKSGEETAMAHDFSRPFVDALQLPIYEALDMEEAREYGKTVRATAMSNVEYSERHKKFASSRTMMRVPSHHRIFPGYLVVRKMGTKNEYETWMPDHVFEELYVAVQTPSDRPDKVVWDKPADAK